MADGTSVPIGAISSARANANRSGSLRRFAQRRTTIAFLLCLPLILLVAGLVIYPAMLRDLPQHAEQEDDRRSSGWAISPSC